MQITLSKNMLVHRFVSDLTVLGKLVVNCIFYKNQLKVFELFLRAVLIFIKAIFVPVCPLVSKNLLYQLF